jgi:streptomycin 6-kinase
MVPELVRQRAMAHASAGRRWLDELPEVVADLAVRWNLGIGAPFPGGTAALVVAARDGSGRECALKVAMTLNADDAELFRRSVVVHDLADGQGCAELLHHDADASAMLLERLGPNLHDLSIAVPALIEAVATTLRSFWRPLPDDLDLPTEADQARSLARFITVTWEALGRPCPREVIDRAHLYCGDRADAFDPALAVLVHGDAHGWNTLRADSGGFKFVDPEGLRSSRAHDLSVPMREYNEPLLAGDTPRLVRERAELLASRAEVDPEPVWQWGFIERVSTGLANIRDFGGDHGVAFLEVAERCL